ncbi:amidohydrolase family protein [Aquibium sp. A9E412]|uniref:amidohydrolase family protein n=1 Tax=Aquibium sp. A9E412 TaxID=2976767 RepID=UPI0025B02FB1|nr:amidohydrolase family protein [Aquibium sp. A9E412]MDN2565511.1 amidohydrolase family protein [Aquibium sp. A9E412]
MPAGPSHPPYLTTAGTYVVDCGWLLHEDRAGPELSRDMSMIVRNGRIEAIRPHDSTLALPRLDARAHLVLPGLISGHTHVIAGLPTRGVIEKGRPYMRPLELLGGLDADDLDTLTAANLAEMVRSGCTAQLEMSLTLDQARAYVRVARRWGVRGFPAVMVPGSERLAAIWFRANDRVLIDAIPEIVAGIEAGRDFARETGSDALMRPMMAAHATDTQTPETLEALRAAVAEIGGGLHIHIAQRVTEREAVERLWGRSPVRFLEEHGLFGHGPVFGAHMTAVDWAADADLLRARGVTYVHCPSAGGAGVSTQPYPEALFAGVPAGIGLDTHSNDMLENLKLAVIKGRVRAAARQAAGHAAVRAPTADDAVASATRVLADGLGRPDLGRLSVGACADFAAVDVSGPLVGSGALPPEPLNNLLYANGTAVRHVVIDGRFKLLDGRFLPEDEDRLRARAGRVMERIWERLEAERWFDAHA